MPSAWHSLHVEKLQRFCELFYKETPGVEPLAPSSRWCIVPLPGTKELLIYALVCQTLKYLPVIKDVFHTADVLSKKCKALLAGDAEKFLLQKKDVLQAAPAKLLVQKKNLPKPRYARVNTLKMDIESALVEFKKQYEDAMVPDLLIFPPRTDLHDHPLVKSGSVFLQGKASSMVAVALGSKPRWEVIDACAAPGNKTVHLAALMKGNGKIIACELNKERVKHLKDTIELAGATNVEIKHEDFLNISPEDPAYSKLIADWKRGQFLLNYELVTLWLNMSQPLILHC